MVSVVSVIGMCVSLLISLVLPIAAAVVWKVKNKGKRILSAWFLGAAGFFVTQVIIRLPILSMLSVNENITAFFESHLLLYCVIMAFTAALFEAAGRYAAARLMKKDLTFERGIAAGMGHGGIEAILILGLTYISYLIFAVMINSGSFDVLMAMTASDGTDSSTLLTVKDTLITTNSVYFFLSGYERLLAMIGHIAFSLIIFYFVYRKKDVLGITICVILHFILDFVSSFSMVLSTKYMLAEWLSYAMIYIFLTVFAVVSIIVIFKIKKKWGAAEKSQAVEDFSEEGV